MNVPAEATTPLRLIRHDDKEALGQLAARVGSTPQLWDDRSRVSMPIAVAHFASIYASPLSVVYDIHDGAGMVAVARVTLGWRGTVFAAAWHRRAMGRDMIPLYRTALAAATVARNLLVLDSFIHADNTLARRLTERAGFEFRGRIADAACYNGRVLDVLWYEITRAGLGLEED
jgi:RimJ/RimL family protein N-acetyltransferase